MTQLIRVQSVVPLDERKVRVVFTNGEQRDIDLTAYIATGPIFEPVRNDATFFASVSVEGGTIAWPNGADIDPDALYTEGILALATSVFDGLSEQDIQDIDAISRKRDPFFGERS